MPTDAVSGANPAFVEITIPDDVFGVLIADFDLVIAELDNFNISEDSKE